MSKPTVLYFPLWGRGAAIRFLLKHKGVDFVDAKPGQGDVKPWPELKAEHPQRGGVPWYTNEEGKVMTQSMSILRALAGQHGYQADGPWGEYESNYTIDVLADCNQTQGFVGTFFNDAATDENKTTVKTAIEKALGILDARWADGRKHAAGDKVTCADFCILANDCGVLNNEAGAKHKDLAKEILEIRNKYTNVVRVIDNIRGENGLDEFIKAQPAGSL